MAKSLEYLAPLDDTNWRQIRFIVVYNGATTKLKWRIADSHSILYSQQHYEYFQGIPTWVEYSKYQLRYRD